MAYKNKAQRREAEKKLRLKKRIEKYGYDPGEVRGKHGHHANGNKHPRWIGGRRISSNGYVLVKVPVGHHLRQKHGYAYEHRMVAEKMLGRRLKKNEVVHHGKLGKTINKTKNLEVKTKNRHAKEHDVERGRDKKGRFQ